MKSALELAMEKADRLSGEGTRKLNEPQKQKIAEARNQAEARTAETRIMMDKKLQTLAAAGAKPEEVEKARREFQDQIAKIARDVEAKVEKIRGE